MTFVDHRKIMTTYFTSLVETVTMTSMCHGQSFIPYQNLLWSNLSIDHAYKFNQNEQTDGFNTLVVGLSTLVVVLTNEGSLDLCANCMTVRALEGGWVIYVMM